MSLRNKNWTDFVVVWSYISILTALTAIILFVIYLTAKIFYADSTILNNFVSPVIAFTGVILTFLAFWQQYKANFLQKNQFLKQSFETQYFELLKLYTDFVKEMELGDVRGKQAFEDMYKKEFLPFYQCKGVDIQKGLQKTIDYFKCVFTQDFELIEDSLNEGWEIKYNQDNLLGYKSESATPIIKKENLIVETCTKYRLPDRFYDINDQFYGVFTKLPETSLQLPQYFRLLYHLVKYVAEYDSTILSEKEKYQYLKTLRTQLSPTEQLFILFNAFQTWGDVWIKEGYITKYCVCKNIWEHDLDKLGVKTEELYEYFNKIIEDKPDLKVEKGKNQQGKFIFQFEEMRNK